MAVLQYFVAESGMMMQACIPRYSEDESGEPAVTSKRGGGGVLSELKVNPGKWGRFCLKIKS